MAETMHVIEFTAEHMAQAERLALACYEKERRHVPELPVVTEVPHLRGLAEIGLGVAAFDGADMLGFLCGLGPFDNAFGIPGLRGVFSPMGGNGTVKEDRAKIYARLYQAAASLWARAGAASHAVCLYAHDTVAQAQFFRYGFGMRTVDAVRETQDADMLFPPQPDYTFGELTPENRMDAWPLEVLLRQSYTASPFFMFRTPPTEAEFMAACENAKSMCFVARRGGQAVAFIRAEHDGETFIQDTAGYLHCTGMYCLPEDRNKGVSQYLLSFLLRKAKALGFTRLGVDYESINPSGSGFWAKHFSAYTCGVVRRIDETATGR